MCIRDRLNGVLTAIAIIPWALPPIVNGVMWRWIFHPSFGFLNRLLLRLDLVEQPVQWLNSRWSICLLYTSRCVEETDRLPART